MMKINYEICEYNSERTGECVVCGKRVKIRQKFWQSISPFNRNKKDEIKSREEIYAELIEEVKRWKEEPLKHRGCK